MAITWSSSSAPAGYHSTLVVDPDADFDRRWTAWKARRLAHERAVTHKFMTVAILAGTIATAAAIAHRLLSS